MLEFNATFIIAIISFVIFIFVMNIIFYKPILNIINERKKLIDSYYSDAEDLKAKTENLFIEKDNKLAETLHETKRIISESTKEAQDSANLLINAAKSKAKDELQKNKEFLDLETQKIKSSLNVDYISDEIVSKIMRSSK